MTRGILRQEEEWRSIMQAQRFPFIRKNLETGKEEMTLVQGALRPIQIYEYIIPENALKDVLGGLGIKGPIKRKEILAMGWMLRKMLKLEQIPEVDGLVTGYTPTEKLNGEKAPACAVHDMLIEGVAVYPIGIRRDAEQEADWGGANGKFKQEML